MTFVALDDVHLGRTGVVPVGDEIPATYQGDAGDSHDTDFERLVELGVAEKQDGRRKAKPVDSPADPDPELSDSE